MVFANKIYDVENYFNEKQLKVLPKQLIERTNDFYANNGRDIERTTKFICKY